MKIQTKILNYAILATVLLMPGLASAIEGELLGVAVGHPRIETNVDTNLTCAYDGTTLTLQSQAAAVELTPGGTTALIFSDNTGSALGGLLDITAQIDSTGSLLGGTLTVTGAFLDGGVFGDPNTILSGDIVDFGILDGGTTDTADFRVTNLTGDLTTHPDWSGAITDVGVLVDIVNSAYDAATGFNSAWSCDASKAAAGPTAAGPQGCNLSVMKTAMPDTVGPEVLGDDTDDSDSDSGHDHDWDGDTDNSDSHSSDNSSDSDGPTTVDCGCKGAVKELTMRWNAAFAETVMVKNNRGKTLFAATLLQPGEEFTFAVKGRKIKLFANGSLVKKLKVRCKFPIGPGQQIGNFEVVSGFSRARQYGVRKPLCPFPGTTCGPEFEVTYDYKVTNSGPGNATDVVVFDDQLGVIDSFATNAALQSIPAGGMVTVSTTVCIFDTTVNVATVHGISDSTGEACDFDPTDNTAIVTLLPPVCGPGDSDSDSHSDHNFNGDTDDSDSDSGPGDCDGDSGDDDDSGHYGHGGWGSYWWDNYNYWYW